MQTKNQTTKKSRKKVKPTPNFKINTLVAIALCDWSYDRQATSDTDAQGTIQWKKFNAEGICIVSTDAPPEYCTDRNALPELWQALTRLRIRTKFWGHLNELIQKQEPRLTSWEYMTADPRHQAIAALKAAGKWPEEWTDR